MTNVRRPFLSVSEAGAAQADLGVALVEAEVRWEDELTDAAEALRRHVAEWLVRMVGDGPRRTG